MRELVRVVNIDEIKPVEGADAIECAVVGGWEVVVKKGEFMPGDSAFYFEIDSWIPHALAPFLTKGKPKVYNGVEGNKLKTVRMRGQLSQGLLISKYFIGQYLQNSGKIIEVLVDEDYFEGKIYNDAFLEGLVWTLTMDDLKKVLNVQLWEAPEEDIPGFSNKERGLGAFPNYVPKTDQTRIQNLGRQLHKYKDEGTIFEVTEKVEGQSMTVIYHEGEFIVCSRNRIVEEGENNLWRAVNKYNLKEKLTKHCETFGLSLAIQGELVGPGIQKNIYKLTDVDFYVFDVYDISKEEYCDCHTVNFITSLMKLKHVPILDTTVIYQPITTGKILELADGYTLIGNNPKQRREGLVFKSVNNPGNSFKAVSNKYLLGEK